jgi:hypothetical protein
VNRMVILCATALVCAAGGLGCVASSQRGMAVASESVSSSWPSQVAGRQSAVVTNDYAVYAVAQEIAIDLGRYIDTERAAFRVRYPGVPITKGIVVAIEPGEESSSYIRDWEIRDRDRRSWAVWAEPPCLARPYAFGREPYFRESFCLSGPEAEVLIPLKPDERLSDWICFVSTDPYFDERFGCEVVKARRTFLEGMKQFVHDAPLSEVVKQWWIGPLFYLMHEVVYAKYWWIDRELMHLQRREALWAAWLNSGIPEPSRRKAEVAALRDQSGEEWERIWERRPMD